MKRKTRSILFASFIGLAAIVLVGIVVYSRGLDTSTSLSATSGIGESIGLSAETAHVHDDKNDRTTVVIQDVDFPDGEVILVKWHRRPSIPIPDVPYGEHLDELYSLANAGDSTSAFVLYNIMQSCRFAPESEVDLNEAIDKLQQTHEIAIGNSGDVTRIADPEQIPMLIEVLKAGTKNCGGITAAEKARTMHWLEIAASENGASTAKVLLASEGDDSGERERLYRESWEQGNIDGLYGLSHELQLSYNSGDKPTNKVAAYAALFAYTELLESGFTDHGEIANRQLERVRRTLDEATKLMVNYELVEATRIAKDLIRSNPNCCLAI